MDKVDTTQIALEELKELLHEKKSWTGYLWQDDQTEPYIFHKEIIDFQKYFISKIPFIIEGLLVNTSQSISITLKHIDGMYYIHKSENFVNIHPTEIFPANNRLKGKGIQALEFVPVFEEVDDPFSPGFSEYAFSHQIFKGIIS